MAVLTGAATPADVLAALRAMLAGGPALWADAADQVPDGTAAVIATSGSSGVPKRVVVSRRALDASADATAARIGVGRWLLTLPATYIAGLQVLHRSLRAGFEPMLLPGRFSTDAFADAARAMADDVAAYTSLVPAQLARLLDAEPQALRRFAVILVGGQSLPAALGDRARDVGARIVRTYGSTETCGGCVYDGVPLDGVAVRVTGGEVQLSGTMLADGYLGDPARTAEAFPVDGGTRWYRTGDAGAVHGGVLQITGRLDNVIISGGINVSLDRVEHIVRALPGLEQCAVVGVADARWGQASAVLTPGPVTDPEALLAAARSAVASAVGPHARPAHLFVTDEPVLLASGKPDRARLRALAAARLGA